MIKSRKQKQIIIDESNRVSATSSYYLLLMQFWLIVRYK
jgi:hypothetical protein